MSGVVVIVCIPTEQHEKILIQRGKKRVTIREDLNQYPSNFGHTLNTNPLQNLSNKHDLNDTEYQTMHKLLGNILKQMDISNATWSNTPLHGDINNSNFLQIMFSLKSADRCEEVLKILEANQFGRRFNSTVSVIPCTIHYGGADDEDEDMQTVDCVEDAKNMSIVSHPETSKNKNSIWNRFISSVRARLTVAQIAENVKVRAALTFDFICLLLISTLLCAIGLTENSNVYLLSSMLISPMMGPVMAGTFGSVIQDKRLQKIGVQNELLGLGLATIVGFVYGTLICIVTDKYGSQDWPTYEMTSRGELRTLWVGCLIALLSGAAVALGILSDNIASLVGVAISTSLMPPAVNAGLLWSLSFVYYLKGTEATRYTSLTSAKHYFSNRTIDLLTLGAISICLTFVNIICIYFAGILVFKIKEVAPLSVSPARRQFWRHDIKAARDYNKTLHQDELSAMEDPWRRMHLDHDLHLHHSIDLTRENFKINIRRPEYTWTPRMDLKRRPGLSELYGNLFTSGLRSPNAPSQRKPSQTGQVKCNANNEKLPLIKETASVETVKICRHKKFIVTPCETDPLLK